jgi:hypothetical protein
MFQPRCFLHSNGGDVCVRPCRRAEIVIVSCRRCTNNAYVLVAATVKLCGSVAGLNAQCGCAINQKVTAKAAILSSVMTISTTTHGTKTLTGTASFATAGFAQGDQV